MKILVDSSAWIDYLNGVDSAERVHVREALGNDAAQIYACGLIATEVLQGLRRDDRFPRVVQMFEEIQLLEPTGLKVYFRAAEIYRRLRAQGRSIRSTIDCLIVAFAEAEGCALLARDRDLDEILASGVTRVQHWPPRESIS